MDRMLNAVKMSVPPRATDIECKPYQNPNGLCWKDGKAEAEVDKELQGALKSWKRIKLENTHFSISELPDGVILA